MYREGLKLEGNSRFQRKTENIYDTIDSVTSRKLSLRSADINGNYIEVLMSQSDTEKAKRSSKDFKSRLRNGILNVSSAVKQPSVQNLPPCEKPFHTLVSRMMRRFDAATTTRQKARAEPNKGSAVDQPYSDKYKQESITISNQEQTDVKHSTETVETRGSHAAICDVRSESDIVRSDDALRCDAPSAVVEDGVVSLWTVVCCHGVDSATDTPCVTLSNTPTLNLRFAMSRVLKIFVIC